jgi:anhydro-N-acetylmuramic acid kinase
MVYRALGLMSGSSLDGLDLAFVEFHESASQWQFTIRATACYPYTESWTNRLRQATDLSALDYQLLHTDYGHYLGQQVNRFIEDNGIAFQVQLIGSHGHTTFHVPGRQMTAQLGDGAAIAAMTGINTVSDLRAMDIALGGQGAPIVPIGDRLLWSGYNYLLNLGGIANITIKQSNTHQAFDICPANRVLNLLVEEMGHAYDDGGAIAATGTVNHEVLQQLNAFPYYKQKGPKSLANDFGTNEVYPLLHDSSLSIPDALATYTEHIAIQLAAALPEGSANGKMLVTGGGAHNTWLVQRIQHHLHPFGIEAVVPDAATINFKEAIVMAFIAVLRWREENNVDASVTGARRSSVGGALWMGE